MSIHIRPSRSGYAPGHKFRTLLREYQALQGLKGDGAGLTLTKSSHLSAFLRGAHVTLSACPPADNDHSARQLERDLREVLVMLDENHQLIIEDL